MMTFGDNLISLREQRGLERKDLAEMLGIPYTTLRNYEISTREPGHKLLLKIANLFSVSVDSLICPTKMPTNQKAVGLSNEAYDIGRAYDTASEKDKATVRLVLSVEPSAEPKLYTFVTAAKGKGLREAQLTEANMEAARRAVRELEGKD